MSYKLHNQDSQEQFAKDSLSGLFDVHSDAPDSVAYYDGKVVGYVSGGKLNQAVEAGQATLDAVYGAEKMLSPDFAVEVTPEVVQYFQQEYPQSMNAIEGMRNTLEGAQAATSEKSASSQVESGREGFFGAGISADPSPA